MSEPVGCCSPSGTEFTSGIDEVCSEEDSAELSDSTDDVSSALDVSVTLEVCEVVSEGLLGVLPVLEVLLEVVSVLEVCEVTVWLLEDPCEASTLWVLEVLPLSELTFESVSDDAFSDTVGVKLEGEFNGKLPSLCKTMAAANKITDIAIEQTSIIVTIFRLNENIILPSP